ncbi:MAG TPA: hypothetical protein VN650_15825 [Gemmatimonadaceae bacterium]|nr:hypothetical protein [Gemmatimonadaceae bacterium]
MSRALTIQRTTIPPSERARYLTRLTERAAHYAAAGCRFWVFEDPALRNAFVEFTEADDSVILAEAVASAPGPGSGPLRIYHQVEF